MLFAEIEHNFHKSYNHLNWLFPVQNKKCLCWNFKKFLTTTKGELEFSVLKHYEFTPFMYLQ